MLQLEKIDPKANDSDEAENSFAEQVSEVEDSEEDEDEEEYGSEEEELSPVKQ